MTCCDSVGLEITDLVLHYYYNNFIYGAILEYHLIRYWIMMSGFMIGNIFYMVQLPKHSQPTSS